MSGTTAANPLKMQVETVESPALHVGRTGTEMVQTAIAGTGKDDIWDGMEDLDLGG
jgi:hypothetical protein